MEKIQSSGHSHLPEEDDDDGFPDQIVYHDEDHLQNLFRLYTRPEQDNKPKCRSESHPDETDLVYQRDHVLPALPSVQEAAVWNALEDALECSNYDNGNQNISDNARPGGENISGFLEHELRAEDRLINQSVELISNVKEVWNLKDAWYSTEVNANPGDILPTAVMKNKSQFKQQKGNYKKKLSFSFGTINNKKYQSTVEQKLPLAEQLLNLAKPSGLSDSSTSLQNQPKNMVPSTSISINQRFLQLVQHDSQFQAKKARSSNHQNKCGSSLVVGNFADADGNVNQQDERDGPTQSLILPHDTMHQKLQKALLEAPSVTLGDANAHIKGQVSGFGFTGRLQKIVERERNDRVTFLKMLQTKDTIQGQENCMELKICSKTLEARFAACLCKLLKSPQSWKVDSGEAQINTKLTVIINLQTNADLEVEVGNVIRLYPPWDNKACEVKGF